MNSDWIFASAIKKDKGFEISFPDSDLDTTFYSDDDESCSLLSLDLWKCGWFALDSNNDNLTTLESCKQKGEGLPSFEFSGSSHKTNIDGVPFILYQAFSRTDVPFSAKCKDVVLDVTKQKPTLFFFAATPEGPNEQKMAFVYNLENEVPEIALLEQLGCADDHKKIVDEAQMAAYKAQMEKFMLERQLPHMDATNPKYATPMKEILVEDDTSVSKRTSFRMTKNSRGNAYSPEDLKYTWQSRRVGCRKKKTKNCK